MFYAGIAAAGGKDYNGECVKVSLTPPKHIQGQFVRAKQHDKKFRGESKEIGESDTPSSSSVENVWAPVGSWVRVFTQLSSHPSPRLYPSDHPEWFIPWVVLISEETERSVDTTLKDGCVSCKAPTPHAAYPQRDLLVPDAVSTHTK
ncbi:hypothetical protein BaRGS_00002504, partial [Batillaria attramentaria]